MVIPKELKERGVIQTEEGRGYIPTKRPIHEPEIYYYEEYDTTPMVRKVRQEIFFPIRYGTPIFGASTITGSSLGAIYAQQTPGVMMSRTGKIAVGALVGGALALALARGGGGREVMKTCTKWKDPDIMAKLSPVRLKDVTFHTWGLYFEGKVVTGFTNNSKEGEKGETEVEESKSCPAAVKEYTWSKVKGSADLLPNWEHKMIDDETNTTLDEIKNAVKKWVPSDIEVEGHWKTEDLGQTGWTILDLLTTGTIKMRSGFNATLRYSGKIENTVKTGILMLVLDCLLKVMCKQLGRKEVFEMELVVEVNTPLFRALRIIATEYTLTEHGEEDSSVVIDKICRFGSEKLTASVTPGRVERNAGGSVSGLFWAVVAHIW